MNVEQEITEIKENLNELLEVNNYHTTTLSDTIFDLANNKDILNRYSNLIDRMVNVLSKQETNFEIIINVLSDQETKQKEMNKNYLELLRGFTDYFGGTPHNKFINKVDPTQIN